MKFKCNLTGGEYSFEAMNLLELRNKIIQQENLTELDILAQKRYFTNFYIKNV